VTGVLPGATDDPVGPRAPGPAAIVIVGPDGAGKSALTERLIDRLGGAARVEHIHGRAQMLPRVTPTDVPVVEPHARPPYRGILAFLKTIYLFVDASLTWRFVIPRAKRDGRSVVLERGWWDIAVDPRRYRLRDGRLVRLLGRWLPSPDLHVVLEAPSDVLHARKAELPIEELDRQQARWQRLLASKPGVLRLDARESLDTLVASILSALPAGREAGSEGDHWVAVPPGLRSRWWIPASPGRRASAALAIHHPVSRKAQIGWRIGRVIARLGLLRLLPGDVAPPFLDLARRVAPPGAAVAVATSWRPGRGRILLLDASDRPHMLIKVADDPEGREEIAREADMARTLGAALSAPVRTPPVVTEGPGYVGFAAVAWRPRWSPWVLPEDVAAAMGRLYRQGADEPGAPGYAHGDFAPWNLLYDASGWVLIDWEHARTDAPPFDDLFHFVIQSSALLGRPAVDDILDGLDGRGPLGGVFRAYAEAAGVPLSLARGHLCTSLDAWFESPGPAESDPRELAIREDLRRRAPGSPP
jgi:hypothetical protein